MVSIRRIRPAPMGRPGTLSRPGRPVHRWRGMVTFELAIGMLTACLLAAMLGWSISLVALQARCEDAAVQIARQLARADKVAAAEAAELAPEGAVVDSEYGSHDVRVTITVQARWGQFGPVEVRADAVFPIEGRER